MELACGHSAQFQSEVMTTSVLKKRKDSAVATDATETASVKRTPLRTFREGDCSLSIWGREYPVQGKMVTFYSLTFERSYRDRSGTWRYTKSFSHDDLGQIVSLCHQAERAIAELQAD